MDKKMTSAELEAVKQRALADAQIEGMMRGEVSRRSRDTVALLAHIEEQGREIQKLRAALEAKEAGK